MQFKVLPILYVIAFGSLMALCAFLFPGFSYQTAFSWPIAVAIFIVGALIVILSGIQFRRAATTVNPLTPEKSAALVKTGFYAISRNPMYIGFLLFLVAVAVFLENFLAFFFLPLFITVITRRQIIPEEIALTQIFGDEYNAYLTQVRRWI